MKSYTKCVRDFILIQTTCTYFGFILKFKQLYSKISNILLIEKDFLYELISRNKIFNE